MMRIPFFILFLFITLQFACTPYKSVKKVPDDSNIQYEEVTRPIETQQDYVPKSYYNKFFKLVNNEGFLRNIERIYYGPQTDILRDFAKIDTRKSFGKENFFKFPIASFFSPTAISIPADKREKAIALFKPLIDSFFTEPIKKENQHYEIFILGYTDESDVEVESNLYKELLRLSLKESLSKEEIYHYTSFYRAKEIGSIISTLIHHRKDIYKNYHKLIIDIIEEGRSLEYPELNREYDQIDPKRRITKVYWRSVE